MMLSPMLWPPSVKAAMSGAYSRKMLIGGFWIESIPVEGSEEHVCM